MRFTFKKNLSYLLAIIISTFLVGLIAVFFKVYFLDEKTFYDSIIILNGTLGNNVNVDSSYAFTINFYKFFNIFGLSSINEWSILISFVSSVFILLLVRKRIFNNISSIFFYFITVFLLNLFVFTISKDFIQFLIFLLIFIIIISRIKYRKKILLTFLIFVFEALFFRIYYGLVGCALVGIIVLTKLRWKTSIKVVFTLLLGFIGLFLVKNVLPSAYNSLVNIRFNTNQFRLDSADAQTLILNLITFDNANVFIFILNSIINLLRLIFPIELLFKGSLTYFAFFVYQIFLEFEFLKIFILRKTFGKSGNLIIVIIISYFLVLSLFEPDFGSFLRHELTCAPLLFPFLSKIEFVTLKYSNNKHRFQIIKYKYKRKA